MMTEVPASQSITNTCEVRTNEISSAQPNHTVGQIVQVASRTWPGINQPGGVGRITGVSYLNSDINSSSTTANRSTCRVSVRYVLDGRHEKEIDTKYVSLADIDLSDTRRKPQSLRNRSMLLGRCGRCGSLRTDCGSCDFTFSILPRPEQDDKESKANHRRRRRFIQNNQHSKIGKNDIGSILVTSNFRDGRYSDENDNDDDSSDIHNAASIVSTRDEHEIFEYMQQRGTFSNRKISRHRNKTKNITRSPKSSKTSILNAPSNLGDSDSSSDGESNVPLSRLYSQSKKTKNGMEIVKSQAIVRDTLQDYESSSSSSSFFRRNNLIFSKQSQRTLSMRVDESRMNQNDNVLLEQFAEVESQSSDLNSRMDSTDRDDDTLASLASNSTNESLHSSASDDEVEMDIDNEDDMIFIQPEGNASELPSDIVDRTASLTFEELGSFIDDCSKKLEMSLIPDAKLEIFLLEQEYRNRTWNTNKLDDEAETIEQIKALENKCQQLSNRLIQDLIRENLDQSQVALRKLSNNRLYRDYKTSFQSSTERSLFRRKLTVRGSTLDRLTSGVEELLRRIRDLIRRINENTQLPFDQTDNSSSDSTERGLVDGTQRTSPFKDIINIHRTQKVDSPFDPHPYATKRRRITRNLTRTKRKGKKNRQHASSKRGERSSKNHKKSQRMSRRIKPGKVAGNKGEIAADTVTLDSQIADRSMHVDVERTDVENDEMQPMENEDNNIDLSRTKRKRRVRENFQIPTNAQQLLRRSLEVSLHTKTFNRVPIVDRMQKFLEANENYQSCIDPTLPSRPTDKQRAISSRPKDPLNSKRGDNEQIYVPEDGVRDRQTPMDLYTSLLEPCREPAQVDVDVDPSGIHIADLCGILIDVYPKSASLNVLRQMNCRLSSSPENRTNIQLVFQTILSVLRREGCKTLQDVLSNKDPHFDVHVSLLAFVVFTLEEKLYNSLTQDDGDMYEFFAVDNGRRLMDFIVCQLVDCVWSVMNPSAWSLDIEEPRRVLKTLEPLRNALGKVFLLTERVSRCILRELGCQKWFCVRDGEHVFVSSVDPDEWFRFVSDSVRPANASTKTRVQACGRLGRDVIYSIWQTMAFFAEVSVLVEDADSCRWVLITKLFIDSTLPKAIDKSEAAPSRDQIQAACCDLQNLILLLHSGAMGNLPRHDSFLMDLIQSAILLECKSVQYDEDTRINSYPTTSKEKLIRTNIRYLWDEYKLMNGNNTLVNESEGKTSKALIANFVDSDWMGQSIFYPSSLLLRQVLVLVLVWKELLLKDLPARLNRFESTMKRLVKKLLDESKMQDSCDEHTSTDNDLFEEAFRSGSGASKSGEADMRRRIFLMECAVYIEMFAIYSTNDSKSPLVTRSLDVMKQCENVWSFMSTSSMKVRLDWIGSPNCNLESANLFRNDSYHLHVAAKALMCVALFSVGLMPPKVDLIQSCPTKAFDNNDSQLPYILLCLLVCLDCSSDSSHNMEITTSVAGSLTIVLKLISRILKTPSQSFVTNFERLNLKAAFKKTFQRCLQNVICASYCGFEEDICLQSLLSFLKWGLLVSTQITATPSQSSTDEFDDEFANLDDSILATIDLGHVIDSYQGSSTVHTPSLFSMLRESLEQSNPTLRFVLLESSVKGMSVQGRSLVGKRANLISICLALLASCNNTNHHDILNIVKPLPLNVQDDAEAQYKRKIQIYFTQELCKQTLNSKILGLIKSNGACFIVVMVESCMDLELLQKLPTCNFSRIKALSGNVGEEKATVALSKFALINDGTVTKKLTNIRAMVKQLGLALCDFGNEDIDWLEAWNVDFDISDSWTVRIKHSVEHEYFNVFRIFRRLLFLSSSQMIPIAFDRISTTMIGICSRNLVSLYDILRNQSRARDASTLRPYSHAKVFELFSATAEMLASIVSIILRSEQCQKSQMLVDRMVSLWKDFVSPLLRCDTFDIRSRLFILNSERTQLNTTNEDNPQSSENNEIRDVLRDIWAQRSRDICIFSLGSVGLGPKFDQLEMLTAVFAYFNNQGTEKIWAVPKIFSRRSGFNNDVAEEPNSLYSPLRHELIAYLCSVEESNPLNDFQIRGLRELRHQFYRGVVAPGLLNTNQNGAKRLGTIQLLRGLLDSEYQEITSNETYCTLDWRLLCLLVKGVVIALQHSLVNEDIDDSLVGAIYSCCSSLLRIPATVVESNASGNLGQWVVSRFSRMLNETTLTINPSVDVSMKYFWNVLQWIRNIGNFVLIHNVNDVRSYRIQFREEYIRATEDENQKLPLWNVVLPEQQQQQQQQQYPISTAAAATNICNNTLLTELELTLFPKLKSIPATMKNIYATKNTITAITTGGTITPMPVWIPSRSVTRRMEWFVSEWDTANNSIE